MAQPRPRSPTIAEAFFRTGFGCVSVFAFKIAVVVIIIVVVSWREEAKKAKLEEEKAKQEAERAAASEIASRVVDEFAKETDADGRYVRKQEGPLPDTDVWGKQFRLAYKQHTLSDEVQVQSAGPDGIWDTRDDVVASRSSKLSNKTLTRDAAEGLWNAAKKQLWGKKPEEKKESEKK